MSRSEKAISEMNKSSEVDGRSYHSEHLPTGAVPLYEMTGSTAFVYKGGAWVKWVGEGPRMKLELLPENPIFETHEEFVAWCQANITDPEAFDCVFTLGPEKDRSGIFYLQEPALVRGAKKFYAIAAAAVKNGATKVRISPIFWQALQKEWALHVDPASKESEIGFAGKFLSLDVYLDEDVKSAAFTR